MKIWSCLLTIVVVSAGLAACESVGTPYQPALSGERYGYAEERIDEVTWRVRFAGNWTTGREAVEDGVLYRAAEIAQANGADGFVVLKEDTEQDLEYTSYVPFPHHRFYGFNRFHRFGYPGFGPAYYGATVFGPDRRYTSYATIRLYRGAPPSDLGPAYDAAMVKANLAPRIERPPL